MWPCPWVTVGCLFMGVFVCAMEVSLQMGPFLGEKCRHRIPLGELELSLVHRMGGGARAQENEEEGGRGGPGPVSGGSPPPG